MSTALFRSAQALNVVQGPLGPLAGRLSSLGYIFRDLAGISLAGVLGGGGAFALAGIATSYQKVSDRLRPFYANQQQANSAMSDVIRIANNTRQALDPVAQLYTKIGQAAQANGVKVDASRLTETVSKAARLSGGDADTQNAGLTQFGQAFGSGQLGGDELRSIKENTFRLAKAIADGLQVPISALKQLGADGKLTPQVIAIALQRSAAQIDAEFARLPVRIGQATQVAENNLSVFLGRLDETTGATAGFAKAIQGLGNNIPAVASTMTSLIAVFASRSLAEPIRKATAALGGFVNTGLNAKAAKARPEFDAAATGAVQAVNAQNAAKAESAAIQTTIAKLQEKKAAILGTAAAVDDEALRAREAAGQEVIAIEGQVAARREEAAQLATNIALIEKQRIESANAAAQLKILGKAGLAFGGGATVPAARVEPDRKAELVYKRQLALVNEELVATEVQLATALQAEALAEEAVIAATLEANGIRGSAGVGVARALTVAELELAAAEEAVVLASGAATLAIERQTLAQGALAAASTFGARASGLLTKAGGALSALFGGPVGIALGIAAGAATYFATRTMEAKDAADAMRDSADPLIQKLLNIGVAYNTAAQAARAFAIETTKERTRKASDKFGAAQDDFGKSFGIFAGQIDRSTKQGEHDFQIALGIAKNNAAGRLDPIRALPYISALIARNPNAAKGSGITGSVDKFLGRDPADTGIKAVGLLGDYVELQNAKRDQAQTIRDAQLPLPPPPDLNKKFLTKDQLEARAGLLAEGGTAKVRAKDKYDATKSDLDAKLAAAQAKGDHSFDDEYVLKLAAAETELRKVGDAQRAAAAAAAAHRKALAEQRKEIAANTAELKAAESRTDKLGAIRSKYDQEPNSFDQATKAKADIDSFFVSIKDGKAQILDVVNLLDKTTGKLQPYTRAQAEADKANIDYAIGQPVRDAIEAGQRENEGLALIAAGNANAADLLRERYSLQERIGRNLLPEEYAGLQANLETNQRINDTIAQRNRLVDIQARAAGQTQSAVRDSIAGFLEKPGLKPAAGLATKLQSNYREQLADKISVTLFGDAEAKMRDKLTRAIDGSSARLTTAADKLQEAGAAIVDAAGVLANPNAGPAGVPGGPLDGLSLAQSAANENLATLSDMVMRSMDNTNAILGQRAGMPEQDIVVTATRAAAAANRGKNDPANDSLETVYNKIGKDFAGKVFGANSPLTKAAGRLGSFLQGTQYGAVGSGITSLLGQKGKESELGASIGGGIGNALTGSGGALNKVFSKGLESIASGLGQFAGPIGAIAGSIVGSLVGGLFRKIDRSNATVSGQGAGDVSATGSSTSLKAGAGSLGQAVQSGVQSIADALGGAVGNYLVSIGTFDGKYRVDPRGRTGSLDSKATPGVVDFGTNGADAAVQYAVLDALNDGAIKGIREGAKRLLQAGTDLNQALAKALKFNNVFKELKQYTDPVGAALDDLNVQFHDLINIFNEAGASASDFQDLQKLYDLKRSDAIKQATNDSIANIQDFIDGLKSGSDSPLSRRTVYNNAKGNVDAFRSDIAAGKIVDSDKLLAALGKFQDASRELNGSRGAFFSDFNDILALAEAAKGNVVAGTNGGALPASPFDDPEVKKHLSDTASATQATADGISGVIDAINGLGERLGGNFNGGVNGSSFDYLPYSGKLYG